MGLRSKKKKTSHNIPPWARRIRDLRLDRDMTQASIADILHVSQRVYADYELGNVRIPVIQLIQLAFYYNVSIDYICTASSEPRCFPLIGHNSELQVILKDISIPSDKNK